MNTTSWIAFRALFEKCGPSKKTELLRHLSPEEQEILQGTIPPQEHPFAACLSTEQRVTRIHYSWLIPFMEPLSDRDRALVLSTLNQTQAGQLRRHFDIRKDPFPISSHGKAYLLTTIFYWLIADQGEFVPLEFLPQHPLNCLLTLAKSQIQTLVDHLGLRDLSTELKRVVKAEHVKKIHKLLSKSQKEYLQSLLKEKEPIAFARINLDVWDGDRGKLKTMLHYRGFNRLAKALFGCHPSLLWHICRTLDTGRTKILRKLFIDINNEQIQELLVRQVLELIPMVQTR